VPKVSVISDSNVNTIDHRFTSHTHILNDVVSIHRMVKLTREAFQDVRGIQNTEGKGQSEKRIVESPALEPTQSSSKMPRKPTSPEMSFTASFVMSAERRG
jgi:hypothetical protein